MIRIHCLGLVGLMGLVAACGGSPAKGGNNNNQAGDCGDSLAAGQEMCDGTDLRGEDCVSLSLGAGSLGCQSDCSYDFSGCSLQPNCGNGTIEGVEICDGTNLGFADCQDAGYYGGSLGCAADCTWDESGCAGRCGDGVTDFAQGETCDDANLVSGDGCDATCLIEIPPNCGDGTVDSGEECDGGAANSDVTPGDCPAVCRSNCRCPFCGDGVTDFARGEQCDDANLVDGDGCDTGCQIEPMASCGNGVLDVAAGEECDDGNTSDGDGCDASCQLEPVGQSCGDGTQDALEVCDDSNTANGDTCNPTCNFTNTVTTLATGLQVSALASDNTYLWLAIQDCAAGECGIARIDIAACVAAPQTAACNPTYITGGQAANCACSQGSCPGLTPAPQVVDGDSATATFSYMESLATDGSSIWIGHQQLLRKVDVATGQVTTVAGSYGSCAAIDGIGAAAHFHGMRGLTYWNDYVYLLDGCEDVLRRYDPKTDEVVTVAGRREPDPRVTQQPPYSCPAPCNWNNACGPGGIGPTPGFGNNSIFVSPRYMAADNGGNLYIIDTNGEAIWRYDTVTTWADILVAGSSGLPPTAYTDGAAASATIGRPRGIISDGTSLFFAEQHHATVRQLILSSMDVSTMVGTNGCAAGGATAVRDGQGADVSQVWYNPGNQQCVASPPAGTPIFNQIFGAMTYNYAFGSIFLADGGVLRRIQ